MTISKISTLVSAPWLRQQIFPAAQKLASNLRVVDSVWDIAPEVNTYKLYQHEHIPEAVHFNLKEISTSKEESLHILPVPETKIFQQYVEHLGISNDTHVVVYDNSTFRPAFRTWFLLRLFGHEKVSVLSGGLGQWKHHGYPVTTEEPKVEKGTFQPIFQRHLLRDFESMKLNIKSKAEQVVDTRPLEMIDEFGGIPGAANISFIDLSREDGTLKEGQELKDIFDEVDIDLKKPLVATCQIGMSACHMAVAAHSLGKEDVPVYNGSFAEWSQLASPDQIAKAQIEQ